MGFVERKKCELKKSLLESRPNYVHPIMWEIFMEGSVNNWMEIGLDAIDELNRMKWLLG